MNGMPLHSEVVSIYPDDLFDRPIDSHRLWAVMHVYPRQEKVFARDLCRRKVPFYLPLYSTRRASVTRHPPLFPGYVFVFVSATEYILALETGRVLQSLKVVDQDGLQRDLARLKRLSDAGFPLTPENRFPKGTKVRIRNSGALAGLEGHVVRILGRKRFVVRVDFIQCGASVALNSCDLDVV